MITMDTYHLKSKEWFIETFCSGSYAWMMNRKEAELLLRNWKEKFHWSGREMIGVRVFSI